MNLLKNAAEFLASQRKAFASELVEYCQLGGEHFTVSATVGKTLFRADDSFGTTVRVSSVDFLIAVEDLGFEPKKPDEIIYNERRYEVLAPNNESVWRWSGNNQDTYRIHTKFIGTVAEKEAQDLEDEEDAPADPEPVGGEG